MPLSKNLPLIFLCIVIMLHVEIRLVEPLAPGRNLFRSLFIDIYFMTIDMAQGLAIKWVLNSSVREQEHRSI